MLPSLDNFISFGADALKERPDYKYMVLDIYTTAMSSDQLGENDRVNACKLIESFLLNLRGSVDDVWFFILICGYILKINSIGSSRNCLHILGSSEQCRYSSSETG